MRNFQVFLIYFLIPAIILGFIFWYGFSSDLLKKNVLKPKSENSFVDFGILQKSEKLFSKSVVLTNISHKDLIIEKIFTDCECSSVSFMLEGQKYEYSLPRDLNEKPINLSIPKDLDFLITVNFRIKDLKVGNFTGYLYFEPNFGKVLKLSIRSQIR